MFFKNIGRPNLVQDLWDCAEQIEFEKQYKKYMEEASLKDLKEFFSKYK